MVNYYLIHHSPLKATFLKELHNTPIVGHVGVLKTLSCLKASLTWKGIKQDVREFSARFKVYQ